MICFLYFIGDSEAMTPVTFAFAVGLQISARVSKSLGLCHLVIDHEMLQNIKLKLVVRSCPYILV